MGGVEKAAAPPATPLMVTRVLWIAVVAGALDGGGDEGTRIARGTILQNAWPATNDIDFQNMLILSLVGVFMFAFIFVNIFSKMGGLG